MVTLFLALLFASYSLAENLIFNVECSSSGTCFNGWGIRRITPANDTATQINPQINCTVGDRLTFNLGNDVLSHPFAVNDAAGQPVPTISSLGVETTANNPILVPGQLSVMCMNGTYVCTLHPLMSGKIFAKNETSTIIPTDEPSPPVNNNNEVENSTNTIDNKTDVNVTNGGDTTKPANIFTLSICFFISLILIFF